MAFSAFSCLQSLFNILKLLWHRKDFNALACHFKYYSSIHFKYKDISTVSFAFLTADRQGSLLPWFCLWSRTVKQCPKRPLTKRLQRVSYILSSCLHLNNWTKRQKKNCQSPSSDVNFHIWRQGMRIIINVV